MAAPSLFSQFLTLMEGHGAQGFRRIEQKSGANTAVGFVYDLNIKTSSYPQGTGFTVATFLEGGVLYTYLVRPAPKTIISQGLHAHHIYPNGRMCLHADGVKLTAKEHCDSVLLWLAAFLLWSNTGRNDGFKYFDTPH